MESPHPVCHPTENEFDKAASAYRTEFNADPPGSGRSEARYQAIILALEIGVPATEQDIKDFEISK